MTTEARRSWDDIEELPHTERMEEVAGRGRRVVVAAANASTSNFDGSGRWRVDDNGFGSQKTQQERDTGRQLNSALHERYQESGAEASSSHQAVVHGQDPTSNELNDHTVPYIADDIAQSGPNAQEMEAVLQSVPFGFTQVEIDLSRATRKRSSIVVISTLAKELASIQLSTANESEKRRREIAAERKKKLEAVLRLLLAFAALLESVYVLVSVPLRIGFLFDPWSPIGQRGAWTPALTTLSVLDVVGEVVLLTYVYVERKAIGASFLKSASSQLSTKSAPSTKSIGRSRVVTPQPTSFRLGKRLSIPAISLFSVREDDQAGAAGAGAIAAFETASVIQDTRQQPRLPMLFKLFLCLPLDLVAAVFLNYTWLHLARAVKLVVAGYSLPLLYAAVLKACRQFQFVRMLSFSTLDLPFQLFWLGLYLCHVTGCGYMLVAHLECGVDFSKCSRVPVPGCWVLKDRLERGSFWRQYIRTMYWASKTVTTLGQGDLVPTTQFETNYCIIVQFVSGLWATAFLSACSFYFSRRHADLNECASTRLEQALTFLRKRHVPTELAAHIRAYHQYLQRTRNGIEEDRILADLPAHYHKQCSSYVMMRLVRRVPFFAKQPKEFMKTLLTKIESDFLTPNQAILGVYDLEELIVVARGELRVLDVEHKLLVHTVESGHWYAEHALFQDRLSRYELVAGAFCEVYCLSRQNFVSAMEQHFPKMKIALLQVQYFQDAHLEPASSPTNASDADRALEARVNSGDMRLARIGSVSKTSHLIQSASDVPWRFPNSRFRRAWRRWKVALTIYLAIEVPFEVAFDWRGGVLGPASASRALLPYALALAIELFFYVDVYFRARVFVRTRKTGDAVEDQAQQLREARTRKTLKSARASQLRLHHGLIVRRAEISRCYLNHGDVLLDCVTTLPIAMLWGLVSKDGIGYDTVYYMRFFRLLALVRLAKLQRMMRKIMLEHDLSPASQLLGNVTVFCIVSASAVACCFFLVADTAAFDAGVPPGFDGPGSVSADRCLEDASVLGNCTWFVYDLSAFDIRARYLRSLHWSVVLLSTVGYGDILSFSDSECFIGFWWIFLGALICYFTSCAVSSVIAQVTVLDAMRSRRAETINRALVRAGVSNATRRVIRRHFETNWTLNGSVLQEAELLQHLPRSQRHELACSLYLADLCRCFVFAAFRPHSCFLRDVALLMRSEIFVPKVVLVNCGHLAAELYLIQSGDVEVLVPRVERRHRVYETDYLSAFSGNNAPATGGGGGGSGSVPRPQSLLERLLRRQRPNGHSVSPATALQRSKNQARRGVWDVRGDAGMVPIAVMRRGDCVGEESLLPHEQCESKVSVRTVTSTQVAVLTRAAAASLTERYPDEVAQICDAIAARRAESDALFRRLAANLTEKDKVKGFLGSSASLYAENKVHANHIIGPESARYKAWRAVQGGVLLYNFFQITFRLAFLPSPSDATMRAFTLVDYACDALLAADIYLKWNRLGFVLYGDTVVDLVAIRKRYLTTWCRLDCLSLLPTYYYGRDYFAMTLCRLPRLLRTPQLLEIVGELEAHLRERFLRRGNLALLSWFDLVKFLLLFLSAGHQIGSVYYTIGRLMVKHKLAPVSWITADTVLTAYPDSVAVHYIRSLYWCLETFTVVCFGDVVARNAVETVYSASACVIGWFCIGQVMGQITSLMAVMDQDKHEHNERVEAFEQYAKKKRLPSFLRERSKEGLEYKSTCLLDLTMADTFRDLPTAFHVLLFDELYGNLVRRIPELTDLLSEPQLQAFTNALRLELYLPEDLIIEEGRVGAKLFLMKSGAAEVFSPHSRMTFAAVHEGVLFGDVPFFLIGTKHLVSVRASRSCEVLFLHRRDWLKLWPEATRAAIEHRIVPAMTRKYHSMARAFRNIYKNFELARSGSAAGAVASVKTARSVAGAIVEEPDEAAADDDDVTQDLLESGPTYPDIESTARTAFDAVVKGSRRKLSVHLGLSERAQLASVLAPLTSSATGDDEWRRHAHNLQVLALIDVQRSGDTDVQSVVRRSSTPGLKQREAAATPPSKSATSVESSVTLPLRIVSPQAEAESEPKPELGLAKHVTVNRGLEGASPRVLLRGSAKRYTIQSLNSETKRSISAVGAYRDTAKAEQRAATVAPVEVHESLSVANRLTTDERVPLVDPENKDESPLFPLATLQQLALPLTQAAASMARRGSEGHLYATHLETLKARSKRRRLRKGVFQSTNDSDDGPDAARNPYEIWVEPRLPPSFCLESSTFRHVWNAVMLGICWYYILVVPFRISFDFEFLTEAANRPKVHSWFALEYVLDALCAVDFVLQKNLFTYIYKGEVVTDPQAIRAHYLNDGSYVADLVCVAPLELLALLYSAVLRQQGVQWDVTWYRVAVFRTNKMVRILRLHELSEQLQRTLVYDWKLTFITPGAVYFTRFAFDFALGAHWVACFFYAVSYNTFVEDGRLSWLTTPGMLAYSGCAGIAGIGNVPIVEKFARAYHFSMGAITTVSYGDIAPQNAVETLLGALVIVVSIVLFGMLAGGFFHLFEMELGQRADYEERVSRVAHYMVFHRFHPRIWTQLQVYFAVHWRESKGMNEDELLRGLPTSVCQDIILYVKRDFVVHMKLFATCEEAFVRAVVTSFQLELYVRHDVIIAEGDSGRSLYVIENGSVLVRVTKPPPTPQKPALTPTAARVVNALRGARPEVVEIVKGRFDFFGEKSLILDVPRSATCVALSSCSMLILTVDKYREILDDFPEYRERNMREWLFSHLAQEKPTKDSK
ncbi:hypothetical protein PybrP1_008099 [[Pythium] brassicae (nom. inval.)]|nr:hypothetical protein PybrP1_008099 [[Pythium] brassicae (nom. inval.)]